MSGLKEIRKKITSVNNTKKTTRAMKLVSTSKLRKVEEMSRRATVFANKLNEVFYDIIRRVHSSGLENMSSKFFNKPYNTDISTIDIICITSDKGLCGSFNNASIKETVKLKEKYEAENKKVRLRCIGKKGITFFSFNQVKLHDKIIGLSSSPNYENSNKFINGVISDFLNGKTDEVTIVHNGFKNILSQELRVQNLVPFYLNLKDQTCTINDVLNVENEDEISTILDELAQRYIEYNMYYSLLDSLSAEHSARMQAMDVATNNADSLLRSLTVSYNKARQEAITTELVEINAGVEAMKS